MAFLFSEAAAKGNLFIVLAHNTFYTAMCVSVVIRLTTWKKIRLLPARHPKSIMPKTTAIGSKKFFVIFSAKSCIFRWDVLQGCISLFDYISDVFCA